jgi:hypothetical protein
LTDYQRGVLALRLKPIMKNRAMANSIASGGDRKSDSPKSDEPITPIRTDAAVASLVNLGKDTIRKIETIEREGAPELIARAQGGEISINLAAMLATVPHAQQVEIIARGEKEILEAIHNHRAGSDKKMRSVAINGRFPCSHHPPARPTLNTASLTASRCSIARRYTPACHRQPAPTTISIANASPVLAAR